MIKTQSAKGVGQPSQKEFLLCGHLFLPYLSPVYLQAASYCTAKPHRAGIKVHVIVIDSLPSSGADQRSH